MPIKLKPKTNPKNVYILNVKIYHGDWDFQTNEDLVCKTEKELEYRYRCLKSINPGYRGKVSDFKVRVSEESKEHFDLWYKEKFKEDFIGDHEKRYDLLKDHSFLFCDQEADDSDIFARIYEMQITYFDEKGIEWEVEVVD